MSLMIKNMCENIHFICFLLILHGFTRKNALKLMAININVLMTMLSVMLEKMQNLKKKVGKCLDLSGKMFMLSQRNS